MEATRSTTNPPLNEIRPYLRGDIVVEIKTEYTATSLIEYINIISKITKTNRRTLYRGQANEEWEITSKAYRGLVSTPSREELLFSQNRLLNERCKLPNESHLNDIRLLADLQHNEKETILIDYSLNPLVALWFACKDDDHKKENGTVYCLQHKGLTSKLFEIDESISITDLYNGGGSPSTFQRTINSDQAYIYHPPLYINQRIINQQSVFVINLDGKIDKRNHISIKIEQSKKDEILADLALLGVTEKVLFLDENGFTKWSGYNKEEEYYLYLVSSAEKHFRNYQYKEAIEGYSKALKLAVEKNLYGENSLEAAVIHNDLGVSLHDNKNPESALKEHETALGIRKKLLGEKHPDTALSFLNLGRALTECGNLEEAKVNYDAALKTFLSVYKKSHPDTAYTYTNIGHYFVTCAKAQDSTVMYKKALTQYEKALDIRKIVLGNEHIDVARAYKNIGGVYSALAVLVSGEQRTENCKKALEYYQWALDILNANYNEEHPVTSDAYNSMGVAYTTLENYEEAINHYKKAIALREKVDGEEHIESAKLYYNNLGKLYYKLTKLAFSQDNCQNALEYNNKALKGYQKSSEDDMNAIKEISDRLEWLKNNKE